MGVAESVVAGLELEVDGERSGVVGIQKIVWVAIVSNEEIADGLGGLVCPEVVYECKCTYALGP